MTNHHTTCDPERIELFLQQKLSGEEQTAFELHLDDCHECRQRLEATAAGDDVWSGVRDSLRGQQLPPDGLRPGDSALDPATSDEASSSQATVLNLLAPTDDDRMIGRWGTYEVVGVIGTGGMGVVLKAFEAALNRYVAIKVLAPHLGSSGAARKRFSREAQAAAAVVHDNVIEIHGVADAAGLPYLVMPYVRGPSLQRRLDAEGPLAVVEILRVGMQAAAGLAAAHAQGLVHRDVKPANILLADGVERVKLTDFGLARAADDASLTKTGIIAGTPQYMSPEQARGEAVDQRSDLFSLGSVLYAMCTGRPPFRAETSYGVLRRITDDEPRPIREINPEIPAWLCRIVAKLMAKQPDDRFQSAREVAGLLEECLAHVQQPTVVPLPAAMIEDRKMKDRKIKLRTNVLSSCLTSFCLKFLHFKGVLAMVTALGIGVLGLVLLSAAPPDIAGHWKGEDWGQVVLKKTSDTEYTGSYSDTVGKQPGEIQLKWSRIEGRYNGTWREGEDRFGDISVRLVGEEIRGALTTDPKSKINPATPRLADLTWVRAMPAAQARKHSIGIYLVTGGPKDIFFDKVPVADLKLAADALINEDDICGYDWESHTIRVKTQAAADRVLNLGGGAFVLVVDGQRLYSGQLKSCLSSYVAVNSPKINIGPIADQSQPKFAIRILPPWRGVPDPRGDARLKRALQDLHFVSPDEAAKPAVPLAFGPLVEHVISQNDADSQGFVFFSFCSGKPVKPPASLILRKIDYGHRRPAVKLPDGRTLREISGDNALAEVTPELAQWIAANHVDALFRLRAQQWDIQPLDMKGGNSVPEAMWNESAVCGEIENMFSGGERSLPVPTFHTPYDDCFHIGYAFEARGGLRGILQCAGLNTKPRGVKIRYKLVQPGKLREAGSADGEHGSLLAAIRSAVANWSGDVSAVVSGTIRQEVGRQLKKAGASYDDLSVPVAEQRDDATPFAVRYRGLRNFKAADGTTFENVSGEFIMAYIGGGRWQGSLAGTRFTVSVGKTDNIDLPFVADPEVLGEWKSVDFVAAPSDFNPDRPSCQGELHFKGLTFLPDGKTSRPWYTWTKGVLIHHGDKTAEHYEIKEIKGRRYMFVECKNGDVMFLGRKPMYSVFRWSGNDAPATADGMRSGNADQGPFNIDIELETMQNMVFQLHEKYELRVSLEYLDLDPSGKDAITIERAIRLLEEAAKTHKLSEEQAACLAMARKHLAEGKSKDTVIDGPWYSWRFQAHSTDKLLDAITKDTPYTWRRYGPRTDPAYVIFPKNGSLLQFPVTLNTEGLSLDQAVKKILDREPRIIRMSIDLRPGPGEGCEYFMESNTPLPAFTLKDVPAMEALCQVTLRARPTFTWGLAGWKGYRSLGVHLHGWPWGEAVNGLQARLKANLAKYRTGLIPDFRADVRNVGTLDVSVGQAQELCELELDGNWHIWWGNHDVKNSLLPPGRRYTDIPIRLVKDQQIFDYDLSVGRHTLRVAFVATPTEGGAAPVRFVSNPVEFEIVGPRPPAGEPPRTLTLGINQYLNLDNGTLVSFNAGQTPTADQLRANGVNLYLAVEEHGKRQLYSLDVAAREVVGPKPRDPETVAETLRSVKIPAGLTRFPSQIGSPVIAFRTSNGNAGVAQVTSVPDAPPAAVINYQLLPELRIDAAKSPWGEPVEGMKCRLRPRASTGKAGQTPEFWLDLRNTGRKDLDFVRIMAAHCDFEVDGQWYGWSKPLAIGAPGWQLQPGEELDEAIGVRLTGSWARSKNNRPEFAPGVDRYWGEQLALTPGRHKLRVAFRPFVPSTVTPLSNVVEFEIAGQAPVVEPIIQWGDEVHGLQMGLNFDRQRPVYHRGDAVCLRLYARNRSDKPMKLIDNVTLFHGRDEALLTSRVPTVQDASGNKIRVTEPDVNRPVGPRKTELLPGKTMLVGAIVFGIGVQPGDPWGVWADLKPGTYQVSQTYSFEKTEETTWSGQLTTGKLALKVAPGNTASGKPQANGDVGVKLPPTPAATSSFGPVIERVLPAKLGSGIDFESGRLLQWPAEWTNMNRTGEFKEENRWVEDTGIAATTEDGELRGHGTVAAPCKTAFDNMTPQQVMEATSNLTVGKDDLHPMKTGYPVTLLFRTREGSVGVLQIAGIVWDPRGVRIRYKLVQKRNDMETWGESVDGLQARLRTTQPKWPAGSVPLFKADVRNQGKSTFTIAQACLELELDGREYRWFGPLGLKSSGFPPGREYDDIPVALANRETWQTRDQKPLELLPGQHTLRAAFVARSAKPGEKSVRFLSNPVAFEILAAATPTSFGPVITAQGGNLVVTAPGGKVVITGPGGQLHADRIELGQATTKPPVAAKAAARNK